jgi:hypothetical protein
VGRDAVEWPPSKPPKLALLSRARVEGRKKGRMTDREILLDLFSKLARMVHRTLEGVSREQLGWQPDEEANSIAVTVWHFSRAFDVFRVRFFEDQPPEEELWRARGWAAQTHYDPRGVGRGGLGNLVDYTRAEVDAVPILSVDDLLAYFDQVYEALYAYISSVPTEALYQSAIGRPDKPLTTYEWLRNLLADSYGHVGEVKAIKAMWERRTSPGTGTGALWDRG